MPRVAVSGLTASGVTDTVTSASPVPADSYVAMRIPQLSSGYFVTPVRLNV